MNVLEKAEIAGTIAGQLGAAGMKCVLGSGADLSVDQELMDAKFPAGKMKIRYENSILLNEKDKTVYFWEKTTEIKSGFSFGFSGESYSQSGMTLSRKVKAVGFGPGGKAYEYDLDIGQIGSIVKSTAQNAGWKCKTVLSKKKASY